MTRANAGNCPGPGQRSLAGPPPAAVSRRLATLCSTGLAKQEIETHPGHYADPATRSPKRESASSKPRSDRLAPPRTFGGFELKVSDAGISSQIIVITGVVARAARRVLGMIKTPERAR